MTSPWQRGAQSEAALFVAACDKQAQLCLALAKIAPTPEEQFELVWCEFSARLMANCGTEQELCEAMSDALHVMLDIRRSAIRT